MIFSFFCVFCLAISLADSRSYSSKYNENNRMMPRGRRGNECLRRGGFCVDTRASRCPTVVGLCPGAREIQCCFPGGRRPRQTQRQRQRQRPRERETLRGPMEDYNGAREAMRPRQAQRGGENEGIAHVEEVGAPVLETVIDYASSHEVPKKFRRRPKQRQRQRQRQKQRQIQRPKERQRQRQRNRQGKGKGQRKRRKMRRGRGRGRGIVSHAANALESHVVDGASLSSAVGNSVADYASSRVRLPKSGIGEALQQVNEMAVKIGAPQSVTDVTGVVTEVNMLFFFFFFFCIFLILYVFSRYFLKRHFRVILFTKDSGKSYSYLFERLPKFLLIFSFRADPVST